MKNINKKLARGIGGILILFLFSFQVVSADEISVDSVIDLVNEARKQNGLPSLSENETLHQIAGDKLDDMVKNNYFAHTSPEGLTPWYWFVLNGYDYKYAGENLAINFINVEDQHKAWMESPTHRKNILNSNYQEIGVAVAAGEINGHTSIITVQEFGTLAKATNEANDNRNFSGQGKSNLVREGEKMAPTVLSVKKAKDDLNTEKTTMKKEIAKSANYWERTAEYLAGNKFILAYYLWEIAMFIFLLSVLVSPLLVVLVSLSRVWVLLLVGQKISVDFKDNINKRILIKVHPAK